MKSFISNTFMLKLLACLLTLQLISQDLAHPQAANDLSSGKAVVLTSGPELAKMLDLSTRIMLHKTFYSLINETFAPLINAPDKSANLIQPSPPELNLVSQSKITLILYYAKEHIPEIEEYLKTVPSDQVNNPNITADREKFRLLFEKFISNPVLIRKVKDHGDASRPLIVVDKSSRVGYQNIDFYANHPRLKDLSKPATKENLVPADDMKQVMIHLIKSAQPGDELSFNFYDFDLMEIAEEIISANQRGVKITGGIDNGVIEGKEGTRLVYQRLKQFESSNFTIEAVKSVGLNHQKMIALVSKNGISKTLLSSGNPTQSCIGKEGDLKDFPVSNRPKESIPNPNHMIVVTGDLPARIAAADINKTVVYKLRGQKEYPIGGAFQVLGSWDSENKMRDYMIMAFSPNGGRGDINRDIYSQFINYSKGPFIGGFFSFSSPELSDLILKKIIDEVRSQKTKGLQLQNLSQLIGDTRFAMRDFSVLLRLSGKRLIEFDPKDPFKVPAQQNPEDPEEFVPEPKNVQTKKVFIDSPNDPLLDELKSLLTASEWRSWQESIRITPEWFSEKHFELNGMKYKNEVKFHHKVLINLFQKLSNAGSSINFSNAGESNQEQITAIRSQKISNQLASTILYWYQRSGKLRSVSQEATRRNIKNKITAEDVKLAYEVLKFRDEAKKKSGLAPILTEDKKMQDQLSPASAAGTCPAVFK